MPDRPFADRKIFTAGEHAETGQYCKCPSHGFSTQITLVQEMVLERRSGDTGLRPPKLNFGNPVKLSVVPAAAGQLL
jgi:transposase